MSSGPDFIIIGAMKCATSTLHEQLARQDGFFMSQPKEPCFFSDDDQFQRGIGWYRSLFAAAVAGELRGESSTHYTKLPTHPKTLERLRAHLPEVKLVYIMRHPIDRLVSHYIHAWTQREMEPPLDRAVELHSELMEYGRYAMQLRPYLVACGPGRVLPVFLERLRSRPQAELERICAFLGHAGRPKWDDSLGAQNLSSDRLRRSPLRDGLLNVPLLRAVRRRLIPKQVRQRVKKLWTMNERPQLSPAKREELTAVFDRDLGTLGSWLGVELCCSDFDRVASEGPYEWVKAPGMRTS